MNDANPLIHLLMRARADPGKSGTTNHFNIQATSRIGSERQ